MGKISVHRPAVALTVGLMVVAGLASPANATPIRAAAVKPGGVAGSTRSVLLPTGERIRLSGSGPALRVAVRRPAGGKADPMVTFTGPGATYVMPAVVLPYLGRELDRELFNVTRAGAAADRVPVRLNYRSTLPAQLAGRTGLTVTEAGSGVAQSYLTPASAVTFGRALQAQWRADHAAGWPSGSAFLGGLDHVTAVTTGTVHAAAKPVVAAAVKVTVTATGADGKPLVRGQVQLLNLDYKNSDDGTTFIDIVQGKGKATVPAGHYALDAPDLDTDADSDTALLRVVEIADLRFSGTKGKVTVDYRKATVRPEVTVPREASTLGYGFTWDRVPLGGGFGYSTSLNTENRGGILVTPIAAAKIGTQSVGHSWQLAAPGDPAQAAYTYDLAAVRPNLPSSARFAFSAADLATVRASYYSDGAERSGAFLRSATDVYEGSPGVGFYQPVTIGRRRTEYVGFSGDHGLPLWSEALIPDTGDDRDDTQEVTGLPALIPARSAPSRSWLRGPIAPAVPQQNDELGGLCLTCRGKSKLSLLFVPAVDASREHFGRLDNPADGLANARFRLYENGKKTRDVDGLDETLDSPTVGGIVPAPAKKTTFKVVLDVDRRSQHAVLSTASQTVLGFTSAKDSGRRTPTDWGCLVSDSNCRVLPVLQAWIGLPTALDGSLPAGPSTITVSAGRVQHATRSAITSVKVQVRFTGQDWSTVKVTSTGSGRYRGTLNAGRYAGRFADVRVTAADKGGSTIRQTVLRAFRVAG